MRPGVNVYQQESSASATSPTDTGRAFAAIVCQRGDSSTYAKANSYAEAVRWMGDHVGYSIGPDSVESYFRFGGRELFLARVVGGAAAKATANLDDGAAGAPYSLVADALGEGDWYNGIRIDVLASGANRALVITHTTDTSVNEASGMKSTQQALIDWAAAYSKVLRLRLGASANMPAAVTDKPLVGGTDDHASVVDGDRIAALDVFDPELGVGNVCIPGATTPEAWAGIDAHAQATDRVAIKAYPDTPDTAVLLSQAEGARPTGRAGGGFWPWIQVPGFEGGPARFVPPELAVCGKIAKSDSVTKGVGQNKPVAGLKRGLLDWATGVSQPVSREDLDELNAAGVNCIRSRPAGIVIFGWRTLVDPQTGKGWLNLGHRRLQVAIKSKAEAVLEEFVFDEIDGFGHFLSDVNKAIVTRVIDPYFVAGSLYGATSDDAYRVITDDPVNTEETIEDGQANVDITVVESEFAEEINVFITKNTITEGVGA